MQVIFIIIINPVLIRFNPQCLEVAGWIPLLLQLFVHLLSTYITLPHLLSLNESFSCFLQLVPSISFSVDFVYVFHALHGPSPSLKQLPRFVLKHDHTPSHHLPLPAYLVLSSIPTCLSAPFYASCPSTLHRTSPSP